MTSVVMYLIDPIDIHQIWFCHEHDFRLLHMPSLLYSACQGWDLIDTSNFFKDGLTSVTSRIRYLIDASDCLLAVSSCLTKLRYSTSILIVRHQD